MASFITLPDFLQLVQDFEKAVRDVELSEGQSAAVRRMAKAEYERTKKALGLQIHSLY